MLLLFDIDGTLLLRASEEHAAAVHAAIRRVYGVEIPAGHVEAAGRTDLAITRSILLLAGLEDRRIDEGLTRFRAACVEEYAHRAPRDLTPNVAPGAAELLEELAARDDVRLALVTGNLEPIARVKLKAAGLVRYFEHGQGGFGSDHEDRAHLPAIARRRAGTPDAPFPRAQTIVIGDTPRDIACARADGVRVVAVTTGPYRAEQLTEADAVIDRLAELPQHL